MALPRAGASGWTAADLAELPDDGNRYELMQGVLLVSPMPRPVHQRANQRLVALLNETAPVGVEAYLPLDWQISESELYAPDVVVVRNVDLTDRVLRAQPLLAVEILSPSSRRLDQVAKRAAYAEGAPRTTGWSTLTGLLFSPYDSKEPRTAKRRQLMATKC